MFCKLKYEIKLICLSQFSNIQVSDNRGSTAFYLNFILLLKFYFKHVKLNVYYLLGYLNSIIPTKKSKAKNLVGCSKTVETHYNFCNYWR